MNEMNDFVEHTHATKNGIKYNWKKKKKNGKIHLMILTVQKANGRAGKQQRQQ